MIGPDNTDSELLNVFSKFFDEKPAAVKITDTGRGDEDFRNTAIVDTEAGNRYVLKIAALHLDYTEAPSAWCLFTTFCPSDKTDIDFRSCME